MTAYVAAFIGLGANLGNAAHTIREATDTLQSLPQTTVTAVSSLYASVPIDADGDDYVNAVVRLDTGLDAVTLLHALQAIEQSFGRERSYRNAPRTLDLDILLYGQEKIHSDTLQVPHPRMTERAFVLLPLLELDPAIQIPGKGAAAAFKAVVAGQLIKPLKVAEVQAK